MATNPSPQNISCLETLALNVLKHSSPEKIANNINISELDPCFLCNQELFLYEIKKLITLLICGHIYHHDCIETSIKKHSICSKPNCKKEVESMVDSMPGSQNINDLIDISLSLFTDPLFPSLSKKHVSESISKSSSKKVKVKNEDSSMLKKLIKELSSLSSSSTTSLQTVTSLGNFINLYNALIKAEEQVGITNQEVIRSYFMFGKKLEDRLKYYKKSNRDCKAKKKLIDEVTEQLSNDLSRNAIEKRLERARKIYYLFSNIGYEKIQLIKSYSALRISKLSWDEIDAIEEKFE
ncbi:637_t:CDS:1 [Cetraspora pellucida]|uniref:637_t:CDS:1 n=1 Tax=Cetraspora pellucida TaxID=1433469 RepID=A0A9N8VT46_9GLOM|nr:637_t:CDS:1 [Cetraspora pellucida]